MEKRGLPPITLVQKRPKMPSDFTCLAAKTCCIDRWFEFITSTQKRRCNDEQNNQVSDVMAGKLARYRS
jgi:hypothetical protein